QRRRGFGEGLRAADRKPAIAPDGCRSAVGSIGGSKALAEAATTLSDQDANEFAAFENLVCAIGPSAVPSIVRAYQREDSGIATDRATGLLSKLGAPAIPGITAALEDQRWFVQRELARALGTIGTSAAVAPLQTLLRRSDVRVLETAVSALSGITDPAAEKALHMVLKASTGEARDAVIAALVGLKDARVVPMLARVLQESDPFSDDFPLVQQTLGALATMRDDRALSPITAMARKKKWLAWGRTTQMRQACLQTHARRRSRTRGGRRFSTRRDPQGRESSARRARTATAPVATEGEGISGSGRATAVGRRLHAAPRRGATWRTAVRAIASARPAGL
ncbi:MAG: HEAT repeat domain-containing protein, partial [Acidimicrobiia bacterium]